MTALLSLRDLHVTFATPTGEVRAVRGVDLEIESGEILGVVGESGCGKSATFRAALGLSPPSATVTGEVALSGQPCDLTGGLQRHAAMIYQNPGAALNPVFTIGQQLGLVAQTKDDSSLSDLLAQVGLPKPTEALRAYPHEFSGGMRQRAVIALAIAQQPKLLIADEPTTALDVTTQAQILDLIEELRAKREITVAFISHDLAVIRRLCDRTAVMYAGQVVEIGTTTRVLTSPRHPYTQALLRSTPTPATLRQKLTTIEGSVPDGRAEIVGCSFAPRCNYTTSACEVTPPLICAGQSDHRVACVNLSSTR